MIGTGLANCGALDSEGASGAGRELTGQADTLGMSGAVARMLAEHAVQCIDELVRTRRIFGARRRHRDEAKSSDPRQDPDCDMSQPHCFTPSDFSHSA